MKTTNNNPKTETLTLTLPDNTMIALLTDKVKDLEAALATSKENAEFYYEQQQRLIGAEHVLDLTVSDLKERVSWTEQDRDFYKAQCETQKRSDARERKEFIAKLITGLERQKNNI